VHGQAATALLNRGLTDQAYLLAALDFFWISGVLMFVALVFLWLSPRPVGASGAVVAAE
jgi:hypothetical protein